MAACLACLMVAGLAVPSARASVARLVRTVLEEAAPSLFTPEPEPELPGIVVAEPSEAHPSSEATARTEVSPPTMELEEQPLAGLSNQLPDVEFSYPDIMYRQEAENIIASFYPVALQRAGVGGAVRLMLWVDEEGRVVVTHIEKRIAQVNKLLADNLLRDVPLLQHPAPLFLRPSA